MENLKVMERNEDGDTMMRTETQRQSAMESKNAGDQ
jgi:hypothetical protein